MGSLQTTLADDGTINPNMIPREREVFLVKGPIGGIRRDQLLTESMLALLPSGVLGELSSADLGLLAASLK
eukprot:5807214-Amphidinium_carterae.1